MYLHSLQTLFLTDKDDAFLGCVGPIAVWVLVFARRWCFGLLRFEEAVVDAGDLGRGGRCQLEGRPQRVGFEGHDGCVGIFRLHEYM